MKRLGEIESKRLLSAHGFTVPKHVVYDNHCDLSKIAFPVAVKASSSQIMHKMREGAIFLNVCRDDVHKAVRQLRKKFPNATVFIEEMVQTGPKSLECAVGVLTTKVYGKCIMFGAGGRFVEIFEDVSFRKIPINSHDARAMIADTIIGGEVERIGATNCVVDFLLRISDLAEHVDIIEMDLNPVIFSDKRAIVLDAKIVLDE
ncbi:MAG: hypothetical protein DRN20_04320 [Thermoplasmata archaeon]|mgnify:CR=1 FL=1|nr:MAG: hypothetical protein DRN20_04320 [Thermoplasmata archaeon]